MKPANELQPKDSDSLANNSQGQRAHAVAPVDPQEFESRLIEDWPPAQWADVHVVLAVSGGADSVALLRAVLAIKTAHGGAGRLHVAHLNHGLRASAAADAAWLERLCRQLEVPFITEKIDVSAIAQEQGDGWEAAARTVRYDFLRAVAERLGARYVATAHTAEDAVETVLHRILRGTGLAGLAGIRPVRAMSSSVTLFRPLLHVRRCDVEGYLGKLGQDFRVDSSNVDRRFTRNRIRHDLLPLLRAQYNADVDGALLRLATQADEAQSYIEAVATNVFDACVAVNAADGFDVSLDCSALASVPELIQREVAKVGWRKCGWPEQSMGFAEWQLLAKLAGALPIAATVNLPGNVHAFREGDLLHLRRQAPS